MRISRRGAAADHGWRAVELKKLKYRWSAKNEALEISTGISAPDFATTGARHNYVVRLSLKELAELLRAIGGECQNIDADEFVEQFAPVVPALVRMTARACEV